MSYRYETDQRWCEIHPTATVHPSAVIGNPPEHRDWWTGGQPEPFPAIIMAGCRIGSGVTVDAGFHGPTVGGAGTWAMAKSHIAHDVTIGEDCELPPGTTIGGHVTIGNRVRFGIGSMVKPFVTIGDGARIGMGAVVTRDVPAGEVWAGSPAMELGRLKRVSRVVRLLGEVDLDDEALRMWVRESCPARHDDESAAWLDQRSAQEIRPQSPRETTTRRTILGEGRTWWTRRLLAMAGIQIAEGIRDDRRWQERKDPGAQAFLHDQRGADTGESPCLPSLRQPIMREPGASVFGDVRRQYGRHAQQAAREGQTGPSARDVRSQRVDALAPHAILTAADIADLDAAGVGY